MRTPYRLILPLLAAASTLALAAPATAVPSPGTGAGLDAARTALTARINVRLASLKALNTTVNGAQRLTAAHKTTLAGTIGAAQQGLTALATKVAGETTVAALKTDAQSMVDDYRVYVLIEPQAHLTIAIDIESAASAALHQAADKLAIAIDTAKAAGKNVTAAQASLADLRTQVGAADAAIAGKADALLALRPGPDGNAIHGQVTPVREGVHTARTDLHKAAADAKSIKAALGG